MEKEWIAKSENDLTQIAKELLETFPEERIFCFYGEMGVGKTTFIKQICRQLQVENMPLSPTFSIINEYFTKNEDLVYHFDFYRIETEEDLYQIGFDDYLFSGNYCFMEWTENIERYLRTDFVKIVITEDETHTRHIVASL